MKTYEQERDEAAYEYNHFIHERLGFKAGADWANARAQKAIEHNFKSAEKWKDLAIKWQESSDDRDAMIEKLEVTLRHVVNNRIFPIYESKKALVELEEWKKTK